jgi:hypothetical protein
MIGVCKRGCIQEIKRKINPSAAIAYRTRGNGKSEPSNEANIPSKNKIQRSAKKQRDNKPVNAPAPMMYLNAGNCT